MLAGSFVTRFEKVVVLGIYKTSCGKVCSITDDLRSQTKVWELAALTTAFIPIQELSIANLCTGPGLTIHIFVPLGAETVFAHTLRHTL